MSISRGAPAIAGGEFYLLRRRITGALALLLWLLVPAGFWLFTARELLGNPFTPVALAQLGRGPGDLLFIIRLIIFSSWIWLVAIDERAFGPLIFHEPLPAAALTGALLGLFTEGLMLGLLLQAIWPGLQPMGGSRQPVTGLAAVAGVCWLVFLPGLSLGWRLLAGWLVAMVMARLCDGWEQLLRWRNEQRERRLITARALPTAAALTVISDLGLLEAGLLGFVTLIVSVVLPLSLLTLADLLSAGHLFDAIAHGAGGWISPDLAFNGERWLYLTALFALGGFCGRSLPRRGRQRENRPTLSTETTAPPQHRLSLNRLWRLIKLQACFSNGNLQRVGLAALIAEGPSGGSAEHHPTQREQLLDSMLHEGTVNTNPIMAAALLGALDRVLIDTEQGLPPRPPQRLLAVGGTLLAQWGDRVIWGTLRPIFNLSALALLPFASAGVITVFISAGFLLHLLARWRLYRWGLGEGWNSARGGLSWRWRAVPRWGVYFMPLLAVLVAVVLSLTNRHLVAQTQPVSFVVMAIWFIVGLPIGRRHGTHLYRWGWLCGLTGLIPTIFIELVFDAH